MPTVVNLCGGGMNPYPVGSIYLSVNSTNPAQLFGGTWEQIKDMFMLACGNTYAAGSTGGEAEHVLTVGEMPRHEHIECIGDRSGPKQIKNVLKVRDTRATGIAGSYIESDYASSGISSDDVDTLPEGGSHPHNNMPPYLAVYMWKRTA